MSSLGLLRQAPKAGAERVDQLVDLARRGRIRIPEFQRGLKWKEDDVLDLFDSIYRGLPIGSLLFWKRSAAAESLHIGPLPVIAPAMTDAWWVVDGQQRITALYVALVRPLPLPTKSARPDPFVVHFDATAGEFRGATDADPTPASWVPLPALLDPTALAEWIHEWPLGTDREMRRRVFEVGTRIRQYELPLYLVEVDDDEQGRDLLRQIFFRVNASGRSLEWADVHDALYGRKSGHPGTTEELANELASLGMGLPDRALLTTCVLAARGLDVTQSLAEHHRRDPRVLEGAVGDALPALRQALAFLKGRAEIPHLRLLPRSMVLEVLARFFAVHPEPSARTLELLIRWTWRVFAGNYHLDERTLERRAITAAAADEDTAVQRLLELLPRAPVHMKLPATFDARTAESRLVSLFLAAMAPRHLADGQLVDVASLLESEGVESFQPVLRSRTEKVAGHGGPENRLIHPRVPQMQRAILQRSKLYGPHDAVLASHSIGADALAALEGGDVGGFFERRRASLESGLTQLLSRLAGWERGDRDRPSIEQILRRVEP